MFSFHSHASVTPIITFHGPGPNSEITAVDLIGQEVARFVARGSKDYFTISRTSPSAPPFGICTGSTSKWSDDTTLNVHGAELKVKWDIPVSEEAHVIMPPPMGNLTWREESSLTSFSKYKLVDKSKTVIARASTKERRCDVLVHGDERLFDSLLSSWIAYLLYHKSNILAPRGEDLGNSAADVEEAANIIDILAKINGAS